ncbi:MAG: M48 family metallopeptidase, partial [Planctomycetota bacterium]
RRLARAGRTDWLAASDIVNALARIGVVGWHIVAVVLLQWQASIRAVTGGLSLVDQAIALLPVIFALLLIDAGSYPVERRIREAALVRALDEGRPVHAVPSLPRWLTTRFRHGMATVLVPLFLIAAWVEGLDLAASGLWPTQEDEPAWAPWALSGMQLIGAVGALALTPLLLRRVWDTVRIQPGELRERLVRVCDGPNGRVGISAILIWRTSGQIANAAVLGMLPGIRYIVLTDKLIESLPEPELEAVVAHEVAHVKRHHIVWLGAGVLGCVGLAGSGLALAVRAVAPGLEHTVLSQATISIAALTLTLVFLGYISRRFERQADAFAARHLSRLESNGPGPLSESAVSHVAGALRRVARLNGSPLRRWGWRHGSIAERIGVLTRAVGIDDTRLPADRAARRVQALIVAIFVTGTGLTIADLATYPETNESIAP